MKTKRSLAVCLLTLLLRAATRAAGPDYFIMDLGVLPVPGGGVAVAATAINDFGQVTGYFTVGDDTRPFVYSDGTMTALGNLGGTYGSFATGINESGQVAGWSSLTGDSYSHAFRYSGGPLQDLGTLPVEGPPRGDSVGFAINDEGRVTGYSFLAYPDYGQSIHAFVTSGGIMVDLGSLNTANGGAISAGLAINTAGVVTGRSQFELGGVNHAFLSAGGTSAGGPMSDLGTLAGHSSSYGLAINDFNEVAGYSEGTVSGVYQRRAFLYLNTGMVDLGTLAGDQYSRANGINNAGQVVGSSDNSANNEHAFLRSGDQMYDLNGLAVNLPVTGLILKRANAINEQGWIVGEANHSSNTIHAFLAIPTTPPPIRAVRTGVAFEVRWPANANEWLLEMSDTLAPDSWTTIPRPYATTGLDHVYPVPAIPSGLNTGLFFRLKNAVLIRE